MGEMTSDHARVDAVLESTRGATAARGKAGMIDRGLKRAVDIVVSLVLLLLLSPVILACALAIKLESRGPVFYRAPRVGRGGRALPVLKFRKMVDGASGQALTGDRDPRFTRMGRLLAVSKLDELPQLWNVLCGGMSLVGPRPEDAGFVRLHEAAYREILSVRPGVTGLSQLAFAKEAEILDPEDRVAHYVDQILPQKVRMDCLYAGVRTLGMDVRILVWTVLPVLLRRDVAVNRATGRLTMRRRQRAGLDPSSSP